MSTYSLSEKQANSILEMRLQKLTGLERDKIEDEYKALLETIKNLEDILANESRIYKIIKDEHLELKEKYGDERHTEIGPAVGIMNIEDLIPEEEVSVLISKKGFLKRMPLTLFKSQLRGGRGVNSMTTRSEDIIDQFFIANTHDYLLCFTNKGRVFKLKVYQLPETSKQSKGTSIAHFLHFDDDETLTTAIPVKNFDSETDYLLMTTAKGIVKKTQLNAYIHFKNKAIISITLDKDDTLKWVKLTNGEKDVILITSKGMAIRFKESQIRCMGRSARGVKGIKIKENDYLIAMDTIEPDDNKQQLLLITRKGYGKNLKVNEFKCQSRGGIGVRSIKLRKTVKDDNVQDAIISKKENEVMIVTQDGTMCRQRIDKISTQRRVSQGVRIMKLDAKDEITALAQVIADTDDSNNNEKN